MPTIDRRLFIAGALASAAAGPAIAAGEQPPRLRRLSPAIDRIVAPGAEIETIATGIQWAEGPCWVAKGGYLLFSDPPANIMRKWQRGKGVSVFLQPSGMAGLSPRLVREAGSNGLGLDHAGHLLIANSGGRTIDRLDLATKKRTVLISRYQGKRFNSPNDLHVAKDGAVWFTDPPYGLTDPDHSPIKELAFNGVYRWTAKGGVTLIDDGLARPNGIALSPDETKLFVSTSGDAPLNPRIVIYDVKGGKASNRRDFLLPAQMPGNPGPGAPDGMKIARDGTMFCSGVGGMMILSPAGEPLGLIEDGRPIANCSIGDGALYMASDTRVLRMPILIA